MFTGHGHWFDPHSVVMVSENNWGEENRCTVYLYGQDEGVFIDGTLEEVVEKIRIAKGQV